MTWLFVATGVLVWTWLVLAIALAVLNHGRVRRILETKRLLPYTLFTRYRLRGAYGAALAKLGIPAARRNQDVIAAHNAIKFDEMAELRDIVAELDEMPTVKKGKEAIGLSSMFEMSSRPVHQMPSPYTHPMQYPP